MEEEEKYEEEKEEESHSTESNVEHARNPRQSKAKEDGGGTPDSVFQARVRPGLEAFPFLNIPDQNTNHQHEDQEVHLMRTECRKIQENITG